MQLGDEEIGREILVSLLIGFEGLPWVACKWSCVRHTFNSATDNFDQEGLVSQVLSAPQAYGGTAAQPNLVTTETSNQKAHFLGTRHAAVSCRL